jgi:hypothetical protein
MTIDQVVEESRISYTHGDSSAETLVPAPADLQELRQRHAELPDNRSAGVSTAGIPGLPRRPRAIIAVRDPTHYSDRLPGAAAAIAE